MTLPDLDLTGVPDWWRLSSSQAGKVRTTASQSTMVVGENDVAIELLNADGSAIKGAQVSVYFFMPSMPAMNYEVGATVKGDRYAAVIKPTMPGKWAADRADSGRRH